MFAVGYTIILGFIFPSQNINQNDAPFWHACHANTVTSGASYNISHNTLYCCHYSISCISLPHPDQMMYRIAIELMLQMLQHPTYDKILIFHICFLDRKSQSSVWVWLRIKSKVSSIEFRFTFLLSFLYLATLVAFDPLVFRKSGYDYTVS